MTPEQDQLELVRCYLTRLRETVRGFGIYTRNTAPYLSDHVIFALLAAPTGLPQVIAVKAGLIGKLHDLPNGEGGMASSPFFGTTLSSKSNKINTFK